MPNLRNALVRHRTLFAVAAVAFVLLLRPALALADDDCSGSFHIGDFFFGCDNGDDNGIGAFGIIAIIVAIVELILSIIGLSRNSA